MKDELNKLIVKYRQLLAEIERKDKEHKLFATIAGIVAYEGVISDLETVIDENTYRP